MQRSTFLIKENTLFLKTYNRELIVESKLSYQRAWELALDLTNIVLAYKKSSILDLNYIWCSELERKIIFLLSSGKTRRQVAQQCKITDRSVRRIIDRIKKKIYSSNEPIPARKRNNVLYQKIKVTEIPFSALVTNEFDTDEEEIEFGDEGRSADEVRSQIENQLEDSETYKLFKDSPRAQELMSLLVKGYSRKECAVIMKVSLQEIHQKVGRIKERLKKNGKTLI